jgi:hypothetical protein
MGYIVFKGNLWPRKQRRFRFRSRPERAEDGTESGFRTRLILASAKDAEVRLMTRRPVVSANRV